MYLAVGSNLGDKNAYIENGIEELRQSKEIKEVRVSELLVTKPYGGVEQDDFVNGAIALKDDAITTGAAGKDCMRSKQHAKPGAHHSLGTENFGSGHYFL